MTRMEQIEKKNGHSHSQSNFCFSVTMASIKICISLVIKKKEKK